MRPIRALLAFAILTLTACSPVIRIDVGGSAARLKEGVVLSDPGAGRAKVALIDVRGLISDAERPSLLGPGSNPVDRFLSALALAERDPSVKAIVVRISSPGGTVTASDILHREVRRFRETSGKPVVASLGEVAASGGYYLALAADRIIAEPTSITGSIGVIIPTVNISDGLSRIGVVSRSIKSGPNKDLGNPLEAAREGQYAVLQGLVDEYYARFKDLVVARRPGLRAEDLDDATDGRVFSGERAVRIGLADEVGGIREAFAAAKSLAGVTGATLVKYADENREVRSAYSTAAPVPAGTTAINLVQVNLADPIGASETSGIYYLWTPAAP